jgi:hypothetical protein
METFDWSFCFLSLTPTCLGVRIMGKVKNLLMDMEDDAYEMTYKQFTDKWGESHAHMWYELHDPSGTSLFRNKLPSEM